jgi:hypothetical protein
MLLMNVPLRTTFVFEPLLTNPGFSIVTAQSSDIVSPGASGSSNR